MMPAESSCQGKPFINVIDGNVALFSCSRLLFILFFFRMRGHIKRGAINNRIDYETLRNDIWNEVYMLQARQHKMVECYSDKFQSCDHAMTT